jgi:hypothetical protein
MLIPRSLSRSKILTLTIVLILAVGGGLYLTLNYLLPSSDSTTSAVKSNTSNFGPELEAALSLPDPVTVFNPTWFDESLIKQLQNDGTLPIKVGQSGKADPFAPLNSTLKKR